MNNFLNITEENIESEHICCALSDKKCIDSYNKKKEWLKNQFKNGYVFYRLNERAKVFIEYGPSEKAWIPIKANNFLNINCMWVSGKYKGNGYGKLLLQKAESDAQEQGKDGLITVVGKKKNHFMSDGKWFQKQGFVKIEETKSGFILLQKKFNNNENNAKFSNTVHDHEKLENGITVYYSNRCPYTEFHIKQSLVDTVEKRNIPLKIIKLDTLAKAQEAICPATIFSLFYNGKFMTTDVSVCMDSRFDKFLEKNKITIDQKN